MNNSSSLAAAAMFASLFLTASACAAECSFDRNITVAGAPVLAVATGSGDVHITAGRDGEMHIHGRVRSSSGWLGGSHDGNVQVVCDRPPLEQNGSEVRIGKQHDDIYRHVSIDYVIETPRMTELNASSGSGNLDIADIAGRTSANTGSGDVRAVNLAPDAKLETGSGNINARGLGGAGRYTTGSGDIHAEQTGPGDVHASTGSGNIEITGINGSFNGGTGSGWIHANGIPSGNWKLETGSGDVKLRIEGSKGYELDADTSSGDINVDQPITMQGSVNKHHVHGLVNGGGSMIHVSTGSGDIDLR